MLARPLAVGLSLALPVSAGARAVAFENQGAPSIGGEDAALARIRSNRCEDRAAAAIIFGLGGAHWDVSDSNVISCSCASRMSGPVRTGFWRHGEIHSKYSWTPGSSFEDAITTDGAFTRTACSN